MVTKKILLYKVLTLTVLLFFSLGFFNISEIPSIEINSENATFYQENPCTFSIFEMLRNDTGSYRIIINNFPNSEIECFGKSIWYEYNPAKLIENGWDEYESENIKIWIGSNLNFDLVIQSLFWLIIFSLIPRNESKTFDKKFLISLLASLLFYLHLIGEKEYYKNINREFDLSFLSKHYDGSLYYENYFLYLYLVGFLLVSYLSILILQSRFNNILNYLPFVFLIYGTYTSLNINFYVFVFCILGIKALLEKKVNINFSIFYFLFSTIWLFNLDNESINFDVDKIRGFINSSQTYESLIFWTLAFYLVVVGFTYLFNETKQNFNPLIFRQNLIISSALIFIVSYLSAMNKFINYISFYVLGLNKFGIRTLEAIEGNTWRGIAPSAEGMGEFFGFVLLFTTIYSFDYKIKLKKIEIIFLPIVIFGLYKTNNFAAIISLILIIFIYFAIKRIGLKKSIILFFLIGTLTSSLIYFSFLRDYQYSSSSILFEGLRATSSEFQENKNQYGLTQAQQSNYKYILDLPQEESNLSTSLRYLIERYTLGGDIKNIPHVVSIFNITGYLINRAEKWGIFLAKYNPTLTEFLFGYGPQQFTQYYFGHGTNYNYGLFLPHSSLFNYLIFFGMFGILYLLSLIYSIKDFLFNSKISKYFILFLILNYLKSDSLLYVPNFLLLLLIFNYYKIEKNQAELVFLNKYNFSFSIKSTLNSIFGYINYKISILSLLISLLVLFFLNFIHSDFYEVLVDASVGVAYGTPGWAAFQNRMLGPVILKFLINIGLSKSLSVKSFVVFFTIINNLLLSNLLNNILKNQKRASYYLIIFNSLFLLIQHTWLYAWDFIDIFFFIIYGYLIIKNELTITLVLINFLHIFNRESALIMSIVFLTSLIQQSNYKKLALKNKIFIGLLFNFIFGTLYTYYSRKILFIEKAYFTKGIEGGGSLLGGNWITVPDFFRLLSFGSTPNILKNSLILIFSIFIFIYASRNFKKFNIEPRILILAIVANLIAIYLFADFTETRLYFNLLILVLYFQSINKKVHNL